MLPPMRNRSTRASEFAGPVSRLHPSGRRSGPLLGAALRGFPAPPSRPRPQSTRRRMRPPRWCGRAAPASTTSSAGRLPQRTSVDDPVQLLRRRAVGGLDDHRLHLGAEQIQGLQCPGRTRGQRTGTWPMAMTSPSANAPDAKAWSASASPSAENGLLFTGVRPAPRSHASRPTARLVLPEAKGPVMGGGGHFNDPADSTQHSRNARSGSQVVAETIVDCSRTPAPVDSEWLRD